MEKDINPFSTDLSTYNFVETSDGSYTLNSSYFNETLHSHHGALSETDYIYVDGCEVYQKAQNSNQPITILEVGWGIGLGFQRTLHKLQKLPFHFFSLELDEGLVLYTLERMGIDLNNVHIQSKEEVKTLTLTGFNHPQSTLTILIGDARKTIKTLLDHPPFIDAIYQDPFSPKKNPSLWTLEWFQDLKKISLKSCLLSTYSASTRVKLSLVHAGWEIFEREGFSHKKSSTIAKLDQKTDEQLMTKLKTHQLGPFVDKEL